MGHSKKGAQASGSAASATAVLAGGAALVVAVLALGVWLGGGGRGSTAAEPAVHGATGAVAAARQDQGVSQGVAVAPHESGSLGVAPAAQGAGASDAGEAAGASGAQLAAAAAPGDLYQLTGAPTEAEGLVAAEGGRIGQPALVWFHADWCEICQSIKPTVNELQTTYDGRVAFIRMNVDDPASQRANRQYSVRGTPTFLLIDRHGKQLQRFSGWPGEQQVVSLLDQAAAMP